MAVITVDEGLTYIRRKIGEPDSANSWFTNPEIIIEINKAIDKVACDIEYPIRLSSIAGGSVAEQQEYTLDSDTLQVLEVFYDEELLHFFPYREIGRINEPIVYSPPESWTLKDALTLVFFPVPDLAGKAIEYRNIYRPAKIASGDNMPYTFDTINYAVLHKAISELVGPDFLDIANLYENKYVNDDLPKLKLFVIKSQGPQYVEYDDIY